MVVEFKKFFVLLKSLGLSKVDPLALMVFDFITGKRGFLAKPYVAFDGELDKAIDNVCYLNKTN